MTARTLPTLDPGLLAKFARPVACAVCEGVDDLAEYSVEGLTTLCGPCAHLCLLDWDSTYAEACGR